MPRKGNYIRHYDINDKLNSLLLENKITEVHYILNYAYPDLCARYIEDFKRNGELQYVSREQDEDKYGKPKKSGEVEQD